MLTRYSDRAGGSLGPRQGSTCSQGSCQHPGRADLGAAGVQAGIGGLRVQHARPLSSLRSRKRGLLGGDDGWRVLQGVGWGLGLVGLIGRARDGYRPSIQPWQVSFEVWQQKRRASKPFQPPRNGRADRCIREAGKERAGLSQKERLGTRDLREVRTVRVEEGWASQKRPNGPGRHEAQPVQEKSRYPPKSLVMHGNTQQRPTGRCDLRARFDTLPSQVWWEWHKGAGGVR